MAELTHQSRGNDLTQLHRQEETWDLSGWAEPNHYLPFGWLSIRTSIPFVTIMPPLISCMYGFQNQPYAFTQSRYQQPKAHWHLQPTIQTFMVQCTHVLTHWGQGAWTSVPGVEKILVLPLVGEGQNFAQHKLPFGTCSPAVSAHCPVKHLGCTHTCSLPGTHFLSHTAAQLWQPRWQQSLTTELTRYRGFALEVNQCRINCTINIDQAAKALASQHCNILLLPGFALQEPLCTLMSEPTWLDRFTEEPSRAQ